MYVPSLAGLSRISSGLRKCSYPGSEIKAPRKRTTRPVRQNAPLPKVASRSASREACRALGILHEHLVSVSPYLCLSGVGVGTYLVRRSYAQLPLTDSWSTFLDPRGRDVILPWIGFRPARFVRS